MTSFLPPRRVMNPLDAFDQILQLLHKAALDDAHWPAAAALIDETCGTAGNAADRRLDADSAPPAPVAAGAPRTPVEVAQADFGGRRAAALVLVVDPAIRPRIDPVRVSALLGLTPSEARVSALLAEGRAVREIAAATGYKESYVRWLLKQVYRKQGLSGQIALMQRVLAAYALPRR